MRNRLDCELGRSIGQRYDDEGARADKEIGKGDALAVASGHELGLEIATVLLLFEVLVWRRQGRSRRLRRGARARAVEDDGIHHVAWWHRCVAAAAGTGVLGVIHQTLMGEGPTPFRTDFVVLSI